MALEVQLKREVGSRGEAVLRIPDPDYDRHPAYGGAFGLPGLADRVKAVARLLPHVGAYAAYDLQSRVRRWRAKPMLAEDSPLYGALTRDGAAGVRFTPPQMARIKAAFEPHLAALRTRMAGAAVAAEPAGAEGQGRGSLLRAYRSNGALSALQRQLNPSSTWNEAFLHEDHARELFAVLREAFGAQGVLNAASRYQGRPIDVRYLKLLINHAGDGWWRAPFADLGLPEPRAVTMHIDHLWTAKAILYLSDVGERTGPFCYCLGSHRARIGWLEGAIRRANDRLDRSSCSPAQRRRFYALPKSLRRKAKFGNDLPDDHPELERLLASEKRFGSADGDLILFDDRGMHRGGLVEEGERCMAQIRLG